ncbi:MAG: hypothetical protein ACYDCK_09615 [Thermoplasmatota archaeon]
MRPGAWWKTRSTRAREHFILAGLVALGVATRDLGLVALSAMGFVAVAMIGNAPSRSGAAA